jgi:hypothetical protein
MSGKEYEGTKLSEVNIADARGQFGYPKEGERPLLEASKPLPRNRTVDVSLDIKICV